MAPTDSAGSNEAECPICMCAMVDPCRTTCAHLFCSTCLRHSFPSTPPDIAGRCPLCRSTIWLSTTLTVGTGEPLRKPAGGDTIFGSVYLQAGSPGVGEYHFDSPTDCYISYASCPEAWKLDDGSPLPARKAFLNPCYDVATRTFTGSVEWGETTIHNGDARWEYQLVFSPSMNIIAGGARKQFDADGALRSQCRYPEDLIYWRRAAEARAASVMPTADGLNLIRSMRYMAASLLGSSASTATRPAPRGLPDVDARQEMARLLQAKDANVAVVNIQP